MKTMKLFKLFLYTLIGISFGTAWAHEDICAPVYGKHKFFHHIKNSVGPNKFSEPKLVEVEIKRDGTLVSNYHFDSDYTETAVIAQSFPQLTYFGGSGSWELGCRNREPECVELRQDVSGYTSTLNSLIYLDIENEEQLTPQREVAAHREKVLACVNSLRGQIVASTQVR